MIGSVMTACFVIVLGEMIVYEQLTRLALVFLSLGFTAMGLAGMVEDEQRMGMDISQWRNAWRSRNVLGFRRYFQGVQHAQSRPRYRPWHDCCCCRALACLLGYFCRGKIVYEEKVNCFGRKNLPRDDELYLVERKMK